MEAEIRIMQPKAKEGLKTSEVGRDKDVFFLRVSESITFILDFWPQEL